MQSTRGFISYRAGTESRNWTDDFLSDTSEGLLSVGRLAKVVGESAHDTLAEEGGDVGGRESGEGHGEESESSCLEREGRRSEE